jgi:hypothetical protein
VSRKILSHVRAFFARGPVLGLLAALGCSAADRYPAEDWSGPAASTGRPGLDTQPCQDGARRECGVTLERQGNVVSCYHGVQHCVDQAWTECAEGTTETIDVPESTDEPGVRSQALGSPSPCVNNPCDPFCNDYTETPLIPIQATPKPKYQWVTGNLGSFPGGLVKKGLVEPCSDGSDCQFNQYCSQPITADACSHSKCQAGGALVSGCDSCVTDICAAKPECCALPVDTCAHDVCAVGGYLKAGCSTTVDQVCADKPSCCSKKGSWDSGCVDLAVSKTGVTCPCKSSEITSSDKSRCYYLQTSHETWSDARTLCKARGASWDLGSVDDSTEQSFVTSLLEEDTWLGLNANATAGSYVWSNGSASTYRHWYKTQPDNDGRCVFADDKDGTWYDASCTATKRDSLCEGPAATVAAGSGLMRAWSQQCVDAVKTVCAATCDTAYPPAESGDCTPWVPGQTDSSCGSIDLAVGVPCDNNIPVCNHGTKDAPAGIKITHFPANSQQFPTCAPDLTHPQATTCTTAAPIPAGQCINVTGCPGLTGNREIMVNPDGIVGHVSECSCRDNWSLYSGGTCGAPSCAGSTSIASVKPVNMFIMFDRSGSMNNALSGGGTRWSATSSALSSFFTDPGSSGIGVALRFFPDDNPTSGCNDSSCSSDACSDPLVDWGVLASTSSPTDAQEKALLDAVAATGPGGWTPTYPALEGALDWAVTKQKADPDQIYAVVLVTDGQPSKCNTDWSQIRALSASAYDDFGVRTYAVGIQGSNIADLDLLAQVGGTGDAFVASSNNAAEMQAQLVEALQVIAAQQVSCTFTLPAAGSFDPANVVVAYTPGDGSATQNLPKVKTSATCGTGWFYDDNANPTQITLCPNSCASVQADTNALLEARVGCPSTYGANNTSEVYEGVCDQGYKPQWGYLTYASTTPLDSSVEFSVRAATSEAGLATAPAQLVATAHASPTDTQLCSVAGPAGCPIDLYALLGDSAGFPFLQLDLKLNPSSDKSSTPMVDDWKVSYSCPPAE